MYNMDYVGLLFVVNQNIYHKMLVVQWPYDIWYSPDKMSADTQRHTGLPMKCATAPLGRNPVIFKFLFCRWDMGYTGHQNRNNTMNEWKQPKSIVSWKWADNSYKSAKYLRILWQRRSCTYLCCCWTESLYTRHQSDQNLSDFLCPTVSVVWGRAALCYVTQVGSFSTCHFGSCDLQARVTEVV